ncbi:MAG TPA: YceH family protein [Acidobacteriaceae bacterium]|nr:YceH family protein [Acidobacteriaceae bacterium]
MTLDAVSLRVLGCLIEKEIVTPENYPLSLNALMGACNQKSSREPVMDVGEEEVRQALHTLEDLDLVAVVRDSRVAKYEHRARTVLNLRRDETAVLCLLLLRGPQTAGELRSRADRMYSFDGLEAVEGTIARLSAEAAGEDGGAGASGMRPLMMVLPRQPGSREARVAHLLGGPVEIPEVAVRARRASVDDGLAGRVSELEAEVVELRAAVARLEQRLGALVG